MEAVFRFIEDEKIFILILACVVFYIISQSYYSENFENAHKTVYFFTAEWCPHCVKAMPLFKELAQELYEDDVTFKFIDEANNKEILKKFNVTSFPTVVMNINGKNVTFSGERTKQNLKNFISM